MPYQDPFLQQQEQIAGATPGSTDMVSLNMPSMQTETSSRAKQFIDTPKPGLDIMDMARSKAQSRQGGEQQESKPYDATGKTQDQIMAETGQQSELDRSGGEVKPPPQMFSQPAPQVNTQPVVENIQQPVETQQQTRQGLVKEALDNEISQEQPLPDMGEIPKATQNIVETALQEEIKQPMPQAETQDAVFGGDVTVTAKANQPYLNGRINRGTDFAGPAGTKVSLPKGQEWEVVKSRNDVKARRPEDFSEAQNQGWGNSLEVKNKKTGEILKYSHMQHGSMADYKPGDTIKGGQVVGAIGNTGNTHGKTGNHLDVEYYDSRGARHDVLKSQYGKGMFQ